MNTNIKTIDIQAKEWFDKVNGNSYFAAIVTINYGMKDEQTIKIPYEYGYGEQYIYETTKELNERGLIAPEKYSNGSIQPLWKYCEENNIILRTNKQTNCKKKELLYQRESNRIASNMPDN